MLRLSPISLRPGVGPTLCHPIPSSATDGPFRTRKFKLPKIPHDYNNHLPSADVRRLVGQAEQYLLNPAAPFHATCRDFLRRCRESAHLLQPMDSAVILRTIEEREFDPQNIIVSEIMTSQLQALQFSKIPGPALVTFFDFYCGRVPLANPMLELLCEKVPDTLEDLSAPDLMKILKCLERAGLKDTTLCRKVYKKVMARIPQMSKEGMGRVLSV